MNLTHDSDTSENVSEIKGWTPGSLIVCVDGSGTRSLTNGSIYVLIEEMPYGGFGELDYSRKLKHRSPLIAIEGAGLLYFKSRFKLLDQGED